MQTALAIFQAAMAVVVALIAIGRWGGRLERRTEHPVRQLASVTKPPDEAPMVGELFRRLQLLEEAFKEDRRNYLPRSEADERARTSQREREDLWGAIKDLRSMDAAQQRRIDGLMHT